jgi:photosystem II stability/assembly factor-like uncharacterized protein
MGSNMNKMLTLIVILFVSASLFAGVTKSPDDFLGRVHIPKGVEIEKLAFTDATTVYAGTNGDGIYVSYDAGTTWGKIEEYPAEGNYVEDMVVLPDGVIYVAAMEGGIFKTSNYGADWSKLNKGLESLKVQTIARMENGFLFAGTYGNGIYMSTDDGENWARTDEGFRYDNITEIEILKYSGFILAATNGGGFYSSRDTAKTWRKASTGLDNMFINDLVLGPMGNKIYAATNGSGLMYTGDGVTWIPYNNQWHKYLAADTQPLLDTAVTSVGINDRQLLMGTRSAGMYYFDDLWNAWTSSGPLTVGITAIATNSDGTIIASRSYGDIIRSTDDGNNWEVAAGSVAHAEDVQPYSSPDFSDVYVSEFGWMMIGVFDNPKTNEYELYSSTDHGYKWEYLTTLDLVPDALGDVSINDIGFTKDSCIFIATNNNVLVSRDYGKTFEETFREPNADDTTTSYRDIQYDAEANIISFVYQLTVISGDPPEVTQEGSKLYSSMDMGNSWIEKDFGSEIVLGHFIDNETGDWYLSFGGDFQVSSNKGTSYSTIAAIPAGAGRAFRSLNTNLYYKADDGSGFNRDILVSEDEGATFTKIEVGPSLPEDATDWYIDDITADAFGNIYCTFAYSIPGMGRVRELYFKDADEEDFLNLRSCYNMDKIKKFDFDRDGYAFILTNALYKRLAPNKLESPVVISPVNGELGQASNPIFKWHSVDLAEEYELQVAPTDLFDSTFETNVTGDTVCKVVIDLPASKDYWWRLRSKTHATRSAWTVNKFTTGMTPPVLKSPEDETVGVPIEAELVWYSHDQATDYSVQVATDELFEDIVFEATDIADTNITTSVLTGPATFFWRVRAIDSVSKNLSGWSEPWEFKTIMGPPNLISPEDTAIDQERYTPLLWTSISVAEEYVVEVATDVDFTNIVFTETTTDTNTISNDLAPETTFYWHVASKNAEGQSAFCEPWSFTTRYAPVVLTYPENEAVNIPVSSALKWEEHLAGVTYQIQISDTASFEEEHLIEDEIVNNAFEFAYDFEIYTDYHWRVRLILEDERTGMWSDTFTFKTGILAAGLISPEDKSEGIEFLNRIFRWHDVEAAEYYQLQISGNEDFTDLIFSQDSIAATSFTVNTLLPVSKHYWRVKAWNAESREVPVWSEVWEFTTDEMQVVLTRPKDKAVDVEIPVYLDWGTIPSNINEFDLQVSENSDFTTPLINLENIVDSKKELVKTDLPGVKEGSVYFWRVRAHVKTYTSDWTDAWTFTVGTVGISEIAESIAVYPQPANEYLDISLEGLKAAINGYVITDINGKLVGEGNIASGNFRINTNELNTGKYFLIIKSDKGTTVHEFLIEK